MESLSSTKRHHYVNTSLQSDTTMSGRTEKDIPTDCLAKDIPPFAAIIAVADTFDAMTSDRPYRKAFSKEEALRELVVLQERS